MFLALKWPKIVFYVLYIEGCTFCGGFSLDYLEDISIPDVLVRINACCYGGLIAFIWQEELSL